MKRHYWPGAVTADGRTLCAHEAVDSEQQCFEQFDLWEKAFGNPLCEAFCDCGGTRTFYKKNWTVQNRAKRGQVCAGNIDVLDMAVKIAKEGSVLMDGALSFSDAVFAEKKINYFLSARRAGFSVTVKRGGRPDDGLTIAVRKRSDEEKDLSAVIREIEAGGKISVDEQRASTASEYIKRINGCLDFLNADWRAKAVFSLKDGELVLTEIVKTGKENVRCYSKARNDIEIMAEEILLNGSVSLGRCARATAMRRAKEIRKYFLAEGISQKIKVTAYRQDGTYAPFEIAKDCRETERRGMHRQNSDADRKKLFQTASAAEKLLSGGSISVEQYSRATACRRTKAINQYLSENGFSQRVKLVSYKKDGAYFPLEIVCKADRKGKMQK